MVGERGNWDQDMVYAGLKPVFREDVHTVSLLRSHTNSFLIINCVLLSELYWPWSYPFLNNKYFIIERKHLCASGLLSNTVAYDFTLIIRSTGNNSAIAFGSLIICLLLCCLLEATFFKQHVRYFQKHQIMLISVWNAT